MRISFGKISEHTNLRSENSKMMIKSYDDVIRPKESVFERNSQTANVSLMVNESN